MGACGSCRYIFEPLPPDDDKTVKVERETKIKLQRAFGKYTNDMAHQIKVIPTLPYVAKDSY